MNNLEYIDYINNIHPNIRYSKNTRRVKISLNQIDDNFIKNKLYNNLFKFLQNNPIPENIFEYYLIKEIELDYYFNCLYNYIFEIHKGTKHRNTCWAKHCEKMIEIAYDKEGLLLSSLKNKYKNVYNIDGWIKIFGIDHMDFNKDILRKFYNKIKKLFFKNDRIIELVQNIKKNGWSEIKSNQKSGSKEVSNGILGYSKKTKKFMVFHGKHRLIAAKYLIETSQLSQNTLIKFPIIEYEEENFRQSKLIFKCSCKNVNQKNI